MLLSYTGNPISIAKSSNRARSRPRARYRALTVAGLKRVTVGNRRERRLATGAFGEILGIDNEHDWGRPRNARAYRSDAHPADQPLRQG